MRHPRGSPWGRHLRLGAFLAVRYLTRLSRLQTALTIGVMTLATLNLLVAPGLLVGLIDGAARAFGNAYTADLLLTPAEPVAHFTDAGRLRAVLATFPSVKAVSVRLLAGATIQTTTAGRGEVNRKTDQVVTTLAGIDPQEEARTTTLAEQVVEGRFLLPTDSHGILLGSRLLTRYFDAPLGLELLDTARVGDWVQVRVGQREERFQVVGIVRPRAGPAEHRAYVLRSVAETLTNRWGEADEVAVALQSPLLRERVRSALTTALAPEALVRSPHEVMGASLDEIRITFSMLGSIFGGISLVVAAITIFIIIFITALTRQKFIGIMRAIGVPGRAVTLSLVLLSLTYALVGTIIALAITFGFLVPWFEAHPIRMPFSDGTLSVSVGGAFRALIALLVVAAGAAWLGAHRVVRVPPLQAMIGR